MLASTSGISSRATGSLESMPSERARLLVRTRRGAIGAQSARKAVSLSLVSPSTGRQSNISPPLFITTRRQRAHHVAAALHHHRPAGAKFGQAPANLDLFAGSKKAGARRPSTTIR